MQTAYLLIGGNLGNRMANLQQAIGNIDLLAGRILRLSSVYETAAWGKTDQPSFLNQVIELQTQMTAPALMKCLLDIELRMGRERKDKYGPRLIDIDILLYGDQVHETPELRIPHPELPNRRFALVPLAELIADKIHPRKGQSIKTLLNNCPDQLEVKKMEQ